MSEKGKVESAKRKEQSQRTPAESARFGVCGWLRHESNLAFLDGLAKLGRAADEELKRRNLKLETVNLKAEEEKKGTGHGH